MKVAVTIFDDRFGKHASVKRLTAAGLERLIRDAAPVTNKELAQLLKLAEFGDAPSAKGSLRHDANVTSITGVIADYDGGEMTMAEATERLRKAGVAAILYTTASHTAERPRWRAIVFLSVPLAGSTEELKNTHRHWTGVLNAILGGVLKSESFTLSQSYYFGPIAGKPEPEVVRLSGVAIDAIANPPAPVYPATGANGADADRPRDPSRSADLYESVGGAVAIGWDDARIHARFDAHPHAADQTDPARAVQRCIDKHRKPRGQRLPTDTPVGDDDWEPPEVVVYDESFNHAKIPRRRWLIGERRSIGEVTGDVGPPGTNKSMLMLTDAVAIAIGRKILADEVHERGGVLFFAGEDARRDVEARIAAIQVHYGISGAELGGRLRCIYLPEAEHPEDYSLAHMRSDIVILNHQMLEWITKYPDTIAVFVDPITAWHHLMENSNEMQTLFHGRLRSVAVLGKRHVGYDQHVTKASMADSEAHVGNLAAMRGAGAIGAAVRWAFTMAKVNANTALNFAIPEQDRKRYRRLDPLKTSYGPDDGEARIFRVASVPIDNGETVGVLVEIDAARLRETAKQGITQAFEERADALTKAFAAMLDEARPRSALGAAEWLVIHHPELFPSKGGGKPLSTEVIRKSLAGLIGKGISTKKGKIVFDPNKRGKNAAPIDYAPRDE